MITVEASAIINRPVEEVFQFTNDLDKVTQWQRNLVQTKQTLLEARPTGLYGLLQPIIGRAVRKQVKSDVESLKDPLESQS